MKVGVMIIHHAATCDSTAQLGKGVQIQAGVVVNADAKIGPFAILKIGTIVGPGTSFGAQATSGINSIIGRKVTIKGNVILGYGACIEDHAVVTGDVPDWHKYTQTGLVAGEHSQGFNLKDGICEPKQKIQRYRNRH